MIRALTNDTKLNAHTGTSNSFQVNAQSAIAIRYNDHSVLENFHAATTFEILSGEKFYGMFPKEVEVEIFNKNNDKELVKLNFRGTFRKYIIALVLATDLAAEVANPILLRFREKTKAFKLHGADNKDILARKSALNFRDSSDRLLCLKMTIKCSDIAHGAKPLELHKRWSSLVTEEFLSQTEKEKDLRLPHAFVVSRDPKKYAKSQAGFIRFVVLKCYTDFCSFVGEAGDEFRRNIKSNISYWNESKRAILASEHLQEMNENKLQTSSRQQMSLSEYSELPSRAAFTGTVFHNRVKSKDRRNTNNLKKNGTVSMQHIIVEAEVENDDAEGKHQKRKTGTRRFVSSEELLKG